jgi:murein DD-endopeptidase MepM/ murein hydrolase activator NlpD
MVGQRSSGAVLLRVLLAIAVLAAAAFGAASLWTGRPLQVTIHPDLPGIGRRTPVTVKLDDTGRVDKVTVELVQGMDVKPVAEKSFETHPAWQFWRAPRPAELRFDVGRDTLPGLRSGEATLRVTAERSGAWFRRPDPAVAEVRLPVRLAPPSLGVLSGFHYVAQGGCEAVVYRVGEGAVQDGVQSGAWFFPGYPLPGAAGAAGTPGAAAGAPNTPGNNGAVHFALFAVPYDATDDSQVRLTAVDVVGNRAQTAFIDKFFPKPLKYDTIQVNDAFLQRVVPEILRETPGLQDRGGLLENYLEINGDLRRREATELVALGERSAPRFLWNEPFLPMPNAKITAAFAQRRDYRYNGRHVDQQDHLGFDMASVEHASVPASNRGVVLLARFFGIYGNAVVIDHGYGLMSLYGHMSSLAVHEGEQVARGQEIGRSGETGLAGGDHLHFTMLLRGLPVNPVEWWDPHWLQDRLARKLGPASGLPGSGSAPPTAASAAAPPAISPAAARAHRRTHH